VGSLRRALGAAAGLTAAVVLVLVLAHGTSNRSSPKPAAGSASIQFGANVGPLFNGEFYSASAVNAQLAALAATGVTLARADAPWEVSEPQPPRGGVHHYDWRFDDGVAHALAAHRIRWLPVIDYSAPWAQSVPGDDHSPPSSISDYAAYAGAFADRYGSGGTFWRANAELPQLPVATYEIWNEPDSPLFWSPSPNATRYDQLFLAARDAIKRAQPGAQVIIGGLAHAPTSIPRFVSLPVLGGEIDGVGIHPYGSTPAAVLENVRGARAALDALGLGQVPLYVTEFGWATSPPGGFAYLAGDIRPAYIEQTIAELGHLDCGLAAVLLYAWTTQQRNPSNSNDWFGIHPPGGGETTDVRAFVQGMRAAGERGRQISCR
jgi:hypothetical protein